MVQKALDGVSLNLRENEFVAILGPSGSGKTTLLNIIGGLDRYDSGDLIINGISTKKYKDRDWDSYRNHTVGFVFQSYNLIPHQSVLSNVELSLTISGISKSERRERAIKALEQVGLGAQLHKKPNQMSGGQMQRVAIARALVNDPDILLADEPTGALDSETSVQVMELLKEVAKDRLVVMVTHNPELAEEYATRIVKLKDGKIISDSNPFKIDEYALDTPVHKNMGKSSMSFLTALSLSFNNLRTKKARTLLTSFAGSIGIIGIALILSLSNGVNTYIKSIEEDTLSEYPLQIQSSQMDITSMMVDTMGNNSAKNNSGEVKVTQMLTNMFSNVDPNDLESLKKYFDSGQSGIDKYANAVEYSYNVSPQIYRMDNDDIRQVNPDSSFSALGLGSAANSNNLMSTMMSTDVFYEMPEDTDLYEGQYDVKAGHWPTNYNECVIVLTSSGSISDFMLYTLGLRDSVELDEMIKQFIEEENVDTPDDIGSYKYDDFLGIKFKLVNAADYYQYDKEYDVWKDKSDDTSYMRDLVSKSEDITVVGVVQPAENANASMLTSGIGYPESLTKHVINQAAAAHIVKEQLEKPSINVLTGNTFGEDENQNKFNMESLFTVDEDALKNAFGFDTSSLNLDTNIADYLNMSSNFSDLSDMVDLSSIKPDIPELSGLNMEDIMGQAELSVSAENIQQLISKLLQGYEDYAVNNPEADYSKLGESFSQYLQTEEAKQLILEKISNIVQSNIETSISPEKTEELVQNIMKGYQEYAAENQLTDPTKFGEYLVEYLKTPEAEKIIKDGASEIFQFNGDLVISSEQTSAVIDDILSGYREYANANSLPDPSKMGENFTEYLQTSQARQQLSEGLSEIIDTDKLKTQISDSLKSYMQTVMSSYTTAISSALQNQVSSIVQQMMNQMSSNMQNAMQQVAAQIGTNMENSFSFDSDAFKNAININMDENELKELLTSLMTSENTSYDNNLKKFGYADLNNPDSIDIYPKDFESKSEIINILDLYNSRMEEQGETDKVIGYTDVVGTLMSSVTDIVDTISYVLVAFVAISLIVSSIMIGVITYISVLERKKEIGILRAIGASKRNISQVFNAETFIIGLCAGIIGIGLTLLILIPGNMLIHSLAGTTSINASLPALYAVILILLSVLLTLIGGLIPSKKAAKSDPVAALRSE